MTALRSRRLEALFGVPLDDLKTAHIQQLVTNAVTEAFDLDYKRTTYGSSDGDKRALRIDVAALANTAGGVIVTVRGHATGRVKRPVVCTDLRTRSSQPKGDRTRRASGPDDPRVLRAQVADLGDV